MILYRNAHHAIRDANASGPKCIGWDSEQHGWIIYEPTAGAPDGVEPEFMCYGSGHIPTALSDPALQILEAIVGRMEI